MSEPTTPNFIKSIFLLKTILQCRLQSIHKLASAFEKTSTKKSVNKIKRYISQGLDLDSSIKESSSFVLQELDNKAIIARSIFILTFSYLEHYVNDLCEIYKNNFDWITLKLNEINGKGITRAKIYLEKVAKADPLMTNEEWEKFSTYNEIRNKIVHSGSISDEDLKKKISKIFKNNLVYTNKFNEIEFTIKFVIDFITEYHKIFLKKELFDNYIKLPIKRKYKKGNDVQQKRYEL
jgi:hypothetical protein